MKTLKKTLCLVLAVVMAVGVLVIPANAATSFPDDADITHDEAVAVMNSLEILMGDEKGNYNPNKVLSRAEAAVIVARLAMTPAGLDDYVASEIPFDDVAGTPVADWAGDAIAYCVANGIIGGVGNNMFDPNGDLTGAAFARMLLCAVGYKADKEGFAGDGWATAVETEARAQNLHKGITAFNYSAALSRDNAAQMVYNVMNVDRVIGYTGGTAIELPGGVSITQGAVRSQPVNPATRLAADYDIDVVGDDEGEAMDDDYNDIFGRPAKYQVTVSDEVVYVEPVNAVKVYDKDAKASAIEKDLKGYDTTGSITVVTNGQSASATTKSFDDIAAMTGKGYTVEIYASDPSSKVIDTIVVLQPIAVKIADISASRVALSRTDSYSGTNITVTKEDDEDMYNVLADMSEGDYLAVIYNATDNVLSVAALGTVTGKLTGTTSSSVTVNGQKLTIGKGYNKAKTVSPSTDYTALVDANDYVLDVILASTGTTTETLDMLYVVKTYPIADEFGDQTQMFQGILPDGEVITGEYETTPGELSNEETRLTSNLTNKLLAYVVDDDVYSFYAKDTTSGGDVGALRLNAPIKSSDKRVSGFFFSSDVVFHSFSGEGNTLDVKTIDGVQSITSFADNNDYALVTKDSNGNKVVTAVFVNNDKYDEAEVSSDELIFVPKAITSPAGTGIADDGKKTVNIMTVYINGEKTDIMVADTVSTLNAGWYSFSINATTGIYSLKDKAANTSLADITKEAFTIGEDGTVNLVYVNDTYYLDGYASSVETDATEAAVYDVSGEDVAIESIDDLYALLQTEGIGGVTIATVNSTNNKTVSVIYVTSQGEVTE